MEYIKKVTCKCYNCNAISMEKIIVDSERIKRKLIQEVLMKDMNMQKKNYEKN